MLFVGSLLLALVLYEIILYQDQDLELIHSKIPGQYQTPLLNIRIRPPAQQARGSDPSLYPTVLFIHGLSASKSTMIHLGTEFAKSGMNSYLIDLPGHGESTGKFTWGNCQGAVQEALRYLSRPSDVLSPPVPIVLVGHSMGAALAIQAARYDQSVANVIAVSPAAAQVDRTTPRNMLILLGEFDLPLVRRGAIFLFQQATGISPPPLEHFRDRSSPDGSKRMVLLPWTEHSLGIFLPRALLEMANWLEHFYPQAHFDIESSRTELLLKLSICSILLYSLVPGFELLHRWNESPQCKTIMFCGG